MADERDRIRAMRGTSTASNPAVNVGTPFGQTVSTPAGAVPATRLGTQSAVSGLTVTGTQRNTAKEAEAQSIGYSKEYIASRGGINDMGYFNDTPLSGQLNATERQRVTKADGTIDTRAMAKILQEKQIDELVKQGTSLTDATARISAQYGEFGLPLVSTSAGGYDAQGNKVPGGQFNSSGQFVGSSTGTLPTTPTTPQTPASTLTTAQRTAVEEFRAALTEMGLADLADTVDGFIKQDFTASKIKLELPKTDAYKSRFPGMESLRNQGIAINESTYISNERGYLQTLRAYGLDEAVLGSRKALGTYISNLVAPREFEERVNLAVTRVNENPEVLNTFKSFYPEADKSSVAAYLLNPAAGMAIIKKQVRTAEIGAAAAAAGFNRDISNIDYTQGLVTATGEKSYNTIRAEFQRAKQLSDSQRRLAQIEGQAYSDLEAIGGIVGGEAEKLLQSQRRAAREAARFSQKGGITSTSLASQVSI
jgi:hypothetical protein